MQLGLFEGRRKRDAGIDKVAGKNSFVIGLLRTKAKEISREKGSVCSDDLRIWADAEGLQVTTKEAWGAIAAGIFKESGWVRLENKKSEIVSNHAREIKVFSWRP